LVMKFINIYEDKFLKFVKIRKLKTGNQNGKSNSFSNR
jgi:hypothetical protein